MVGSPDAARRRDPQPPELAVSDRPGPEEEAFTSVGQAPTGSSHEAFRRPSPPWRPGAPLTRRRLLLAGAGGVAGALSGCGGGPAPRPTTAPAPGTVIGPVPGFDDPQRWAGRTLQVGAWGGEVQTALRDGVWRPFAAATGCVVEEVTTDYGRLNAAIAAGRPFADVLLVDALWAETAPALGYVQPLGLGALAPSAVEAFGGGEAAAPAFAYALVSAYRRDAVAGDAPPQTWAEWWDAQRYPGRRALARDPFGTFEFALLADGVPPDELYPLDGRRAIEALKEISGKIVERWWDSGAEPVHWLGSERADLASSWHYRVTAGQRDGLAVDLVWNQGLVITDHWVVPVGAREPEMALDFVRYALTPQAQARLARQVPLGPINPAAFELLDPAVGATLPTTPTNLPQLLRPDFAWWAANRGEAVQRFNAWLLGTPGG